MDARVNTEAKRFAGLEAPLREAGKVFGASSDTRSPTLYPGRCNLQWTARLLGAGIGSVRADKQEEAV
jgi:hypothetical protein